MNRDERKENGPVLISCDGSSLVIDKLCDRAGDKAVAVACLYFDFAVQKQQSPAGEHAGHRA